MSSRVEWTGAPLGYSRLVDSRSVSLAVVLALAAPAAADKDARVTCRVPGDPQARVYVLEASAAGASWRLSFQSAETKQVPVRLSLPGARPHINGANVSLTYRNGNGGRIISLSVQDGASALDVWVDYGLDVNVEPDLDPRVDLMNTHGPLQGVQCGVESGQAPQAFAPSAGGQSTMTVAVSVRGS